MSHIDYFCDIYDAFCNYSGQDYQITFPVPQKKVILERHDGFNLQ